MPKKWRCTVCQYVAEGPEPPDVCPVCGADKSKFVAVEEEKVGFFKDMIDTLIVHCVVSHFSNGLLPTAFVFIVLSLIFAVPHIETAVLYLIIAVVAAVPISLISGMLDWQRRYKGAKAPIFYKKITCASLLFVFGCAAVGLHIWRPNLWAEGGILKAAYIGVVAVMLGLATMLGHFGAKLVFQWKKEGRSWPEGSGMRTS